MGTHPFVRPEVMFAKFLVAMALSTIFFAIEKLFILWLPVLVAGTVVLALFVALPLSLMAGVWLISPLVALTGPLFISPYATWTPRYGWIVIGMVLTVIGGFLTWLSGNLGDEDDPEPPTPARRYHYGPRS